MYPRNPQNQSYSALINLNTENRRNQKEVLIIIIYLFMFVLSYLEFIATDWIKITARIETFINLC